MRSRYLSLKKITVSLEFISYQTELSQDVCRIYIGPDLKHDFGGINGKKTRNSKKFLWWHYYFKRSLDPFPGNDICSVLLPDH